MTYRLYKAKPMSKDLGGGPSFFFLPVFLLFRFSPQFKPAIFPTPTISMFLFKGTLIPIEPCERVVKFAFPWFGFPGKADTSISFRLLFQAITAHSPGSWTPPRNPPPPVVSFSPCLPTKNVHPSGRNGVLFENQRLFDAPFSSNFPFPSRSFD